MAKLECLIAANERDLEYMREMSKSPAMWKYINKKFPDLTLDTVLAADTTALREYIKQEQEKRREGMQAVQSGFIELWTSMQDDYFKTFLNYFELDAFEHDMKAFVSILPIYPRDLERFEFNINDSSVDYSIAIAMHEILHFIYFKKWAEIFPEHDFKTYNSPHLVWFLSEILAPIILNKYPASQKLFKWEHMTYQEFHENKIGEKSVDEHFTELYMKHINNKTSIDDFLRLAWSEAQKHEASIHGIKV